MDELMAMMKDVDMDELAESMGGMEDMEKLMGAGGGDAALGDGAGALPTEDVQGMIDALKEVRSALLVHERGSMFVGLRALTVLCLLRSPGPEKR